MDVLLSEENGNSRDLRKVVSVGHSGQERRGCRDSSQEASARHNGIMVSPRFLTEKLISVKDGHS